MLKKFWLLLIVALLHQSLLPCYAHQQDQQHQQQHPHPHPRLPRRIYIKRAAAAAPAPVPVLNSNTATSTHAHAQASGSSGQPAAPRQSWPLHVTNTQHSSPKALTDYHGLVSLNQTNDKVTRCGQHLLSYVQKICGGVQGGGGGGTQKRTPYPAPFTDQDHEKQQSITEECCKKQGCSGKKLMKYCSISKKRPERTVSGQDQELEDSPQMQSQTLKTGDDGGGGGDDDAEKEVEFNWFMKPLLVWLSDYSSPLQGSSHPQVAPVAAAQTQAHDHEHDPALLRRLENELHAHVIAYFKEYDPERPEAAVMAVAVHPGAPTPTPVAAALRMGNHRPGGLSYPRTFRPELMDSDEAEQDREDYREMWQEQQVRRWEADKTTKTNTGYNNYNLPTMTSSPITTTSSPSVSTRAPRRNGRDYNDGPVVLPYATGPDTGRGTGGLGRRPNSGGYVAIIDSSDVVLRY